jgi:hypothetical protein
MAANPSKTIYDSLIRHIEIEAEEGVKFFDKNETSIEKFLDDWKPSKKLRSRQDIW